MPNTFVPLSDDAPNAEMTTVIDTTTGDSWRVPTRAVEAIIGAREVTTPAPLDAPRTDTPDLRAALEAVVRDAQFPKHYSLDEDAGAHANFLLGAQAIQEVILRDLRAALGSATPEPTLPDPIETFSHPYRAPVVIDGHQYTHTSDCEWRAARLSAPTDGGDAG